MEIPILPDIVAIFCLAIAVLPICHKLHIPPIVGLLITGALCGPSALGLVSNPHAVELLSEIGVILLMFTIGMELSGKELSRLRKPILIGGTAQVVLTVCVCTGIGFFLGHSLGNSILYGFLTALSSTAIVLSLLQQQAQSDSPQGRLALAILIFQDIAIVPMMLLIPILAGHLSADSTTVALSVGRTILILGSCWFLAKYAMPRIMGLVMQTRSQELLLMSTLGLCLAIAMGTASLGLSLSLGAFLAGLLLAESEYSLSVVAGVLPFKTVFTSLFFISVGMLLNMRFVGEHLIYVALFALGLMLLKMILIVPATLLLGYPLRICIITAISLGQIGEFSFILAKTAVDNNLLDSAEYQVFLASSILTMALTPSLIQFAPQAALFIDKMLGRKNLPDAQEESQHEFKNHLIIVGFGVGGKHLAQAAQKVGIDHVILEMNPDSVARYRVHENIFHGDASQSLVLLHYGIKTARVLAVVISDPAALRAITALARRLNPKLCIVVRTRFLGEVAELKELGANYVISEDFETSIEIFNRVLSHYLVPRQVIEEFVQRIRDESYDMARQLTVHGSALPSISDTVLSGLEVAACVVEQDSAVIGKKLLDIDLRRNHNVTVIGVSRGDVAIPTPDGSHIFEGGDVVYLFATAQDLSAVMHLFYAPQAT